MKLRKEQVRYALCGGMTKELYLGHRHAAAQANLRLLRIVSTAAALLGAVLLVSSFGITTVRGVRLLYLLLTLSMLVLAVVSASKKVEERGWGTPLFYLLTVLVYLFGAALGGVVQVKLNAVMFCVFLVVMPQLVTDYYWRQVLPGVVMELVFLLLAKHNAAPDIFSVDLLNSFSSLVLGMVLGYSRTNARANEYTLLDKLRGQRDTDALTHLSTRRAAEKKIRQWLEYGNSPCAMVLIDVDNFKTINDTYGHDSGDKVLANVAGCIRDSFRATDLVCRLGGDEFMVFARDVTDAAMISARAAALLRKLETADPLPGTGFCATLSIGIALSPRHGNEFNELYRKADEAMYEAKRGGKNNYALFGSKEKGE